MKKIKELLTSKEHGYSLLEISVAVGLMVIGMAIAIPNFTKAIDTQQANDLKNHMLSAGMIMESARYQNNGVYPSEIPPEILNNPDYADFTYSIDDGAGNYCIMGRDGTNQKYFTNANTTEPYTPSEESPGCTEENVIWVPVDPNEPPAPSLIMGNPTLATGNNVWTRNNYAAALADFSWTSGTCEFSGPLPSYMGGVNGVDYQARVVDSLTTNVYSAFNGAYISANSVSNLSLSGLLPSANIEYQVRMRCLADFEYHYTDWVSLADTVSSFPVEGTGTIATPAPTTEWGAGQTWPVLKFTAASIECPTGDFTPVYKATVQQVGATDIVVDWQASVSFTISLVGFQGNKTVSWVPESGCRVSPTLVFPSTEPYGGTEIILPPSEENQYIPIPPPYKVTNLKCATKYDRLTEASSGNCIKDETLEVAPSTPEEVRWTQTTCIVGTDGYLLRTQVGTQSFSEWLDLGLNVSSYQFVSGFPVGSTITVQVAAYCSENGQVSEQSETEVTQFKADYPPPATDPIEVTWAPSTDETGIAVDSWTETTLQGDSYLYDQFTGTAGGTCTNNVIPSGWKIYIKATFPNGSTASLTTPKIISGSSIVLQRSTWVESQDLYWTRGAAVSFQAEALCPPVVEGVYAASYTNKDSYDSAVTLGYPLYSSDVVSVTCASKDNRDKNSAEANKGGCAYEPTVATQAQVPNELRWSSAVCQTGYTPTYKVFQNGSLVNTTTTLAYPLVGLTVGTDYSYTVTFKCSSSNNARYSTDSPSSTARVITPSYPKSTATPVAPTVSWAYSATDVGATAPWSGNTLTAAGDSYIYDTFTGTISGATCANGYAVGSLYVRFNNTGTGTSSAYNSFPISNNTVTINRSALASWQSVWVEGAIFTLDSYYSCVSNDYTNVPNSSTHTSASQKIGYTAPTSLLSGLNCYIQFTRTTETNAGVGSCTLDATINMTGRSVAPQELRWTAIGSTVCPTKMGYAAAAARYFVSTDNSNWSSNGSSTSYVLPNTLTPGTSYTYFVTYDCYDSASGRYTAKASSSSKTFKASYLKDTDLTNNPATFTYTPSTAGAGSAPWSAVAPPAGSTSYSLWDQLNIAFSSATCPSGYTATSMSASVAGTSGSTTGTPLSTLSSFNVSRSTTNSSTWSEGSHFRSLVSSPTVTCTGGDYGDVALTPSLPAATSGFQIGVNAPSGTASISDDYVTASGMPSVDILNGDYISWTLGTSPTCSGGSSLTSTVYASYNSATSGTLGWNTGNPTAGGSTSYTYAGGTSYGYSNHSCSVATTYFGTITGQNASSTGTVKTTSGSTTTVSYNGAFASVNVAKRHGIAITVTARAAGTGDSITGSYSKTCPTGTTSNYNATTNNFNPYWGYNGNGLTGGTSSTDTGYWNATGFAPAAGSDDNGSFSRNGYSAYAAQSYGFRLASSVVQCINNQTGTGMNLAGWVTFWIKSTSSRYSYGGPGVGSGTQKDINVTSATTPDTSFIYADW